MSGETLRVFYGMIPMTDGAPKLTAQSDPTIASGLTDGYSVLLTDGFGVVLTEGT